MLALVLGVGLVLCPACEDNTAAPVDGAGQGGMAGNGPPMSPPPEAGGPAPAPQDSGTPDSGTPDSGTPDSGTPDSGTSDSGAPDASAPDTGTPDADTPDAAVESPPALLSQTGLYADIASETLSPGVMMYAPRFELWSDGAEKRRWLYLPEGSQIDTSDMDNWRFPVGTKAWKEFTRDGVRVETRLVEKTAADDWEMIAYIWREDGSDAEAAELGMPDARGTLHDVPDTVACQECHVGQPDRLLGFAALQLSHDGAGETLTTLQSAGRLSSPPAGPPTLPTDATALAALGGMHANCGSSCHNPENAEVFSKSNGLILTLPYAGSTDASTAPAHTSTVGVALDDDLSGLTERIVAGAPDDSGLVYRMELMPDEEGTMPPKAVEIPNETLITAVRAWIETL